LRSEVAGSTDAPDYAAAIRAAVRSSARATDLAESDVLVLMTIGYFQPVTRSDLTKFFGRESAAIRSAIGAGAT